MFGPTIPKVVNVRKSVPSVSVMDVIGSRLTQIWSDLLRFTIGGHVAEMEGVSMENPEGQSFGGPFGQDHEAPEDLDQCVEQDVAGDR